jgi:hypothetical protein
MKLYSVDREGWVGVEETVLDAEQSKEWIDVSEGEYLVIDDAGFLYEPYEPVQGSRDYKWRQTRARRSDVLDVLRNYRDGEQLLPGDLKVCRSDVSA